MTKCCCSGGGSLAKPLTGRRDGAVVDGIRLVVTFKRTYGFEDDTRLSQCKCKCKCKLSNKTVIFSDLFAAFFRPYFLFFREECEQALLRLHLRLHTSHSRLHRTHTCRHHDPVRFQQQLHILLGGEMRAATLRHVASLSRARVRGRAIVATCSLSTAPIAIIGLDHQILASGITTSV